MPILWYALVRRRHWAGELQWQGWSDVSMHEALFGAYSIPEDTCRAAHQTFPKANIFMQIRDHFGMLYQNHQFAYLFATKGQPALSGSVGFGHRHAVYRRRGRSPGCRLCP